VARAIWRSCSVHPEQPTDLRRTLEPYRCVTTKLGSFFPFGLAYRIDDDVPELRIDLATYGVLARGCVPLSFGECAREWFDAA
jgi:hypothetical protein